MQVVVRDDLLHFLHHLQVAEHVADTHETAIPLQHLGHLKRLIHRTRRHRLLDEQRHIRQAGRQELLEVAARLRATTERRRRAHPHGMRVRLSTHRRHVVLERRVHHRVLVRTQHKRLTLGLEHAARSLGVRVDQRHDFESRAELVLKTERVIPRTFVGAKVDVAGTDNHHTKVSTGRRGLLLVHRSFDTRIERQRRLRRGPHHTRRSAQRARACAAHRRRGQHRADGSGDQHIGSGPRPAQRTTYIHLRCTWHKVRALRTQASDAPRHAARTPAVSDDRDAPPARRSRVCRHARL